jgi:chromosome segregation ATPase
MCVEDSQPLKIGISNAIRLYDEVNAIIQELYHRKDLSARIQVVNDSYLTVFQNALGHVLFLQREKFRAQQGEIRNLREENEQLSLNLINEQAAFNTLEEKVVTLVAHMTELKSVNRQQSLQIDDLKKEFKKIEDIASDRMLYLETFFPKELSEIKNAIHAELSNSMKATLQVPCLLPLSLLDVCLTCFMSQT